MKPVRARHSGDAGKPVIGYIRVSTDEQADSGAGLEAQRASIKAECDRRGWELLRIYEDAASGKTINGRHGLAKALASLDNGGADALVIAKLDRLSRSLLDFAALMERAREKGWALVALDLGVDTTTPSGEMMANVLAVFAQFERRVIGQRTRDALAVKRAQGIHVGRSSTLDPATVERIAALRQEGRSLTAIADVLNEDQVPTGQGGAKWYPSSVRAVLSRLSKSSGVAPEK